MERWILPLPNQPEPIIEPDVPGVNTSASLAQQVAHIAKQVDLIVDALIAKE